MVEGQINKTLIVAPHMDDEVYGCSSFLGEVDVVAYVTCSHPLFPDGENREEQKKLAETLGFESIYMKPHLFPDSANDLDRYGQMLLIGEFEEIINKYKPEIVVIPSPSYNQDHRAVYDAALTAMRPHDRLHFVKRILLYEEPDTFGTLRKPDAFHPNYYRELDLDFKLMVIGVYLSQLRGHRTTEHIEAIARIRGMQVNMEYAEAFEIVRWIE